MIVEAPKYGASSRAAAISAPRLDAPTTNTIRRIAPSGTRGGGARRRTKAAGKLRRYSGRGDDPSLQATRLERRGHVPAIRGSVVRLTAGLRIGRSYALVQTRRPMARAHRLNARLALPISG